MEIYTHLMVRTLVYGFEYENRYFAVYMSYVGAPACVADIEDTMSIINKDKYVVSGGSGCLDKEIARGKLLPRTKMQEVQVWRKI